MPSTDPGATSKDAMFFEEPVYGDTPYQFRVKKDKIALIPHRTAYGPRAIPKLVEELNSKQTIQVRERASALLAQMFHQPGYMLQALEHGVLLEMKPLLLASVVQEYSTAKKSVMQMAKSLSEHGEGREALFIHKMIPLIADKMTDADPVIQELAFDCLIGFASGVIVPRNFNEENTEVLITGAQAIIKHHITLVPTLLDLLPKMNLDNQARIFNLISFLLNTPSVHEVIKDTDGENSEAPENAGPPERTDLTRLHLRTLVLLLSDYLSPTLSHNITTAALTCLAALFAQDRQISIIVPDVDVALAAADDFSDGVVDKRRNAKQPAVSANQDVATSAGLRKVAVRKGATKVLVAFIKIPKAAGGHIVVQKTAVQAAAMKALALLCVEVEAKKMFVREGQVQTVIDALTRYTKARYDSGPETNSKKVVHSIGAAYEDQLDTVLLHTTKAVSTISEEYRGRFAFQQSLPVLQKIVDKSQNPTVVQAAKQAIKVITWRP